MSDILVEPIINGTLRLVGPNSTNEGRVEIYIDDQWVRVCDDGWDDATAGVACRQLGFGSSGMAQQFQISESEGVTLPIFSCSGNESFLINCTQRITEVSSNCNHFGDIKLVCIPPSLSKYTHHHFIAYIILYYGCLYNDTVY